MPRNLHERRTGGLTWVSPDVHVYYDHDPLLAAIDSHNRERRSYYEADRRAPYMSEYIRSEIDEVHAELEKVGTPEFSPTELAAEFTDVFVVAASLGLCSGVEIDQHRIWPYVNGQGNRSNILERMQEVSGHITQENISDPLHELFILLASAINHAPVTVDISKTLHHTVLPKNRYNHFAPYYSGRDVLAGGANLEPEEMLLQHAHTYQALRLFRKAFAGPEGLPPHEHIPYAFLIHDFRNSAFALTMIKHIIELEKERRKSAIT